MGFIGWSITIIVALVLLKYFVIPYLKYRRQSSQIEKILDCDMDNSVYRFSTKIAGVTFDNPDGSSRQRYLKKSSPSELLLMKREPDNPMDENAIKLMKPNGKQLGYIPSKNAETLAPQMDNGTKFFAQIEQITGGEEGKSYGANIKIFRVA